MAETKGRYWEQFEVGQRFESRARTVTEADIVNFAGLSGDFHPLHTDLEFAKRGQFGERIAHGLLGLVISSGLNQALGLMEDTLIAFLGMTWKFTGPIKIGDTIHLVQTVSEKRATSKSDRGVISLDREILNQRGEIVQEGRVTLLMRRGPAE